MKIAIHILNLDAKIVLEKDGHKIYLPACSVVKRGQNSRIEIEGEEYDAAILIDIGVTYQLAKIMGVPLEEFLNEIVVHELCHIFNPEWKHPETEVYTLDGDKYAIEMD
jgi:hypothetical protein